MGRMEEVVAQSLEATRIKEVVLAGQARQVAHCARHLLETLQGGKAVHLLGEGVMAHLARYVADAYHRPGDGRTLPVRLLAEPGSGADGFARAVEAFVRFGDLLVVIGVDSTPRLERAVALARGRRARVVCLTGQAGEALGPLCDTEVVVPADDPRVVAEVVLSVSHVLLGLVLEQLQPGQATVRIVPGEDPNDMATVRITSSSSSLSDLGVIDRDSDDAIPALPPADEVEDVEEASLLAEAVELGLTPPTDPRGRPLRRRGAPADLPLDVEVEDPRLEQPRSLRFRCGACGEVMNVEARHAGRRGKCPHCLCSLRIPERGGEGDDLPTIQPIATKTHSSAPPTNVRPTTRRRARERRRSTRFSVRDAIVRFSTDGYPDGRSYLEPHSMEDLSLTGLRFVGRVDGLKIGDILYFAVDFPAFASPVRFKGEIRRLLPAAEGIGNAVGIRFLEYVSDAEAKIRRLLEHDQLRAVRRR